MCNTGDTELDVFYKEQEAATRNEGSFHKIVLRKFNAKTGMPFEEEHKVGSFGCREHNRFVGLLSTARLSHENSIFISKEHCRWI